VAHKRIKVAHKFHENIKKGNFGALIVLMRGKLPNLKVVRRGLAHKSAKVAHKAVKLAHKSK